MPIMTQSLEEGGPARLFIYGPPGSGKTVWACKAAEAGFNVILCDLDGKFKSAGMLDAETQGRIYHLDMRAPSEYNLSGAAVLAIAAQGSSAVYFNEATREYTAASRVQEGVEYTQINLRAADASTVLIIDSWSAFMQHITGNALKVMDANVVSKAEWDDYQKIRLVGDNFISNLKRLNCHIIVTGHSETYAKKKADADPKAKIQEQIDSIRVQPASVTRAHGETLARHFNDVLYIEVVNALQGSRISTAGNSDFDALSQSYKPGTYARDDLPFIKFVAPATLARAASNKTFSSAAISFISGDEILAARTVKPAAIQVTAKPSILNLGKKT